jgi:hypothetical protein
VLYQLSYAHHIGVVYLARLSGLEPLTYGLEVRCSVPLSYRRVALRFGVVWSGREDLNLRPPAPKAGALPGCATPRRLVRSDVSKTDPSERRVSIWFAPRGCQRGRHLERPAAVPAQTKAQEETAVAHRIRSCTRFRSCHGGV